MWTIDASQWMWRTLADAPSLSRVKLTLYGLDIGLETEVWRARLILRAVWLFWRTAPWYVGVTLSRDHRMTAAPFMVGQFLLRLAGQSHWLRIPAGYSALHFDQNPLIVGLAAFFVGRMHLWIVSATALSIVQVLQPQFAAALILYNRLTLAFFTYSYLFLYKLEPTQQTHNNFTVVKDPNTTNNDAATNINTADNAMSTDNATNVTTDNATTNDVGDTTTTTNAARSTDDTSANDISDWLKRQPTYKEQMSWISQIYLDTATSWQLLEGWLLFFCVQILAAAAALILTGIAMQFLFPDFLPLRPLPVFHSTQEMLTPWIAVILQTAIRPLHLCSRLFIIGLAVGAYIALIAFWWKVPTSSRGLNELSTTVLRLTGFGECIASAVTPLETHVCERRQTLSTVTSSAQCCSVRTGGPCKVKVFSFDPDFDVSTGVSECKSGHHWKICCRPGTSVSGEVLNVGRQYEVILVRPRSYTRVASELKPASSHNTIWAWVRLPSGVGVSPLVTVLVMNVLLMCVVCLMVGLPTLLGREFLGLLLSKNRSFRDIQSPQWQTLESLATNSDMGYLQVPPALRSLAVPTAQIPDLSTYAAGLLLISIFMLPRKFNPP